MRTIRDVKLEKALRRNFLNAVKKEGISKYRASDIMWGMSCDQQRFNDVLRVGFGFKDEIESMSNFVSMSENGEIAELTISAILIAYLQDKNLRQAWALSRRYRGQTRMDMISYSGEYKLPVTILSNMGFDKAMRGYPNFRVFVNNYINKTIEMLKKRLK